MSETPRNTPAPVDAAFEEVHTQLRDIAAHKLRGRPGETVTPTVLVNELYERFRAGVMAEVTERDRLLHTAAVAMKHILIDHARRRLARRRREGAAAIRDAGIESAPDQQLLAIDAALASFANNHPRKAEVVTMKFFGGLTHEQIADALGVSVATVERDWSFAKAWLSREVRIHRGGSDAAEP